VLSSLNNGICSKELSITLDTYCFLTSVDNKYVHKTGMAVQVLTLLYVSSDFLAVLQVKDIIQRH